MRRYKSITVLVMCSLLFGSVIPGTWANSNSAMPPTATPFSTEQPSDNARYIVRYITPDADILPMSARNVITRSLNFWGKQPPENNIFYLISLRWEKNWALATLTSANLDKPLLEGEESHLDTGNMFALLLVRIDNIWQAAIESDTNVQNLLIHVPESELSQSARAALFPRNNSKPQPDITPLQAYGGYKFPWPAGPAWRVTQGWHDSFTWNGQFPANTSLDFDILGASNSDILASASGSVTYMCNDGTQVLVAITTDGTSEKLGYLHLDSATVAAEGIQQGVHVNIGRKLGRMKDSDGQTITTSCGTTQGTHIHMYFPEKPFTIDNVTFTQSNIHSGENLFSSQGGSSPPSCNNPNADQVVFYVDPNYSGQCVIKGIGDYTSAGAIGLPNDSISSIKVGGSAKVKLCRDDNYAGTCEDFQGDDGNLGDNSIGDNQVSSARVESRGTIGCNPNADQVALYVDPNYGGQCIVKGIGDYTNPGAIGLPNDAISSVKVGGNVKAKLCRDDNYAGTCEDFQGDDSNLGDNAIGDNQVSSVKVQSRGCSPNADQVALYSGTNYSGSCVTLNIGDYSDPGNLAPVGNDNTRSIKVGGNVQAILYWDAGFQGLSETFSGDDSDLTNNSINNQTSSARVRARVQPPAPPAPQSPSIGANFNEGQGITLSWSATGDEYFGEIWGGPGGTLTFGWQSASSKDIGSQWPGYTYLWHVKARNSAGESGWSTTWAFTVRPAAPSNFNAHAVSCNQINLSWTDNAGSEDGFKIYRDGSFLAQVGANATSYQSTGLSANTTYSYLIRTFKGSIESDDSNTATATTSLCATADFDAWPQSGQAPLTVSMHSIASGDITSCLWDYGDGTTGTSCATTHDHVYTTPGSYSVSLTVSGPSGSNTMTRNNYIIVSPPACPDAYEPDNTSSQSHEFAIGDTEPHAFCVNGDEDWVWFSATAGTTYRLETLNLLAGADTVLDLYTHDLSLITSDDDGNGGRASLIIFAPTTTGTYYLKTRDYYASGDPTRTYDLHLAVVPPPNPPSNLMARSATQSSTTFTWQDNSSNESGFKIYKWGFNSGTWDFWYLTSVGPNITTFSDTGLNCGTDYFYDVSAYNSYGESDRAGWIPASTSPCAPMIDLQTTAIEPSAQPICAGSSPDFQARIRNNGSVESGFFNIRWNADGQLADGGHNSIAPGQTDGHGHIWNNISQGPHTLTFIADPNNSIPEFNENNNTFTLNFTAEACPTYSTISGVVTDSSGNPLAGVTISTSDGEITSTNADGSYLLGDRAPSTYTITPSKTGYTFSPPSRTVAVPPDATDVNFIGTQVPVTALQNPGFEDDCCPADGKPDKWSTNSKFTRSGTDKHSGSFAGKFFATDNSGVTIDQTVNSLTAGTTYNVSCWVNIPPKSDSFTFKPQVRWRKAGGSTIRTDTLKTFSAATNGWNQATASLIAPAGTTDAQLRLVASSLNLTIYVDDCSFVGSGASDTTPPTVTGKTPTPGATNVALSATITASFSEAMNGATITNSSFTLAPQGGATVAASVSYNSASQTATLVPSSPLAPAATYTVRLSGTIVDLAGNALASAPVTWSFTTASQTSGARIKNITFEDNSLTHPTSGADTVNGTVTLDSPGLKGNYSAGVNGSSGYLIENFTAVDELYTSFYIKLNALPGSSVRIVQITNNGSTVTSLVLNSNGALQLRNGSANIGGPSTALGVGTIYRIGLHQKKGSGNNAVVEAYVAVGDASFSGPFASSATQTFTTQASSFRIGTTNGGTLNARFDDIRLDGAAMP